MTFFNRKKGMVGAQFNWIFILIVGGVILLFFITMVKNQQSASDLKLTADLLNNLDSIVVGGSLSIGTIYDISLPPNYALQNTCEDTDKTLTFYDTGIEGINLKYNPLFGPKLISGTTLSTYSAYWQQPFIVTTLFYMVSDKVLFFVINDTDDSYEDEIRMIYHELPVNDDPDKVDKNENKIPITKFLLSKNFVKEVLQSENKHYTHINILFFGELDNDIKTVFEGNPESKAKVSIYQIEDSNVIASEFNTNFEVKYYEIEDGQMKSPTTTGALGINSLFGLLFSEDTKDYECNMRKVIFKYALLSDIYYNKSVKLEQYVTDNSDMYPTNCLNYYANDQYMNIRDESKTYLIDSNPDLNEFFSTVSSDIDFLKTYNINLGDSSCPIPY